MTPFSPTPAADAARSEGPDEALLASTSVLMAVYAALGRCATTARGPERAAVLARIVDNLALVDAGGAAYAQPVRESVKRALGQWRELASRRAAEAARTLPVADVAGPTGLASRLH